MAELCVLEEEHYHGFIVFDKTAGISLMPLEGESTRATKCNWWLPRMKLKILRKN